MPIYSRNSVGSDITVTANENYSFSDMGRILVECAQNDMLVFNAALKNDFKENAAIREGTMVSSELTSFREFSVKEAFSNLKAKLKKLWEKIKGVFRQVYAKLTVWLVRNGKAFVALHRKTLVNKTGLDKVKIPKYLAKKKDFWSKNRVDILTKDINNYLDHVNAGDFDKNVGTESMSSADAFANIELGKLVSGATVSNFGEEFKKAAFEEKTDTTWGAIKGDAGGLEGLFNNITSKSSAIKDLKKNEREVDKSIKSVLRMLGKKESEAEKKETGSGAAYKRLSNAVSGYERTMTLLTRSEIQAIKTSVQQDRMVVGKLAAASPNNESALLEQMAWFEGADDFATQEDIPAEEVNAEDIQSDPDVVVNIEVEPEECNG